MTLSLAILLGSIFALILLSAFFSGSETALTATSKARMHALEKNGSKRAGLVQRLIGRPERLLGAILLGNNLVNILASALATSLFLELFGDAGVVYATLFMTALVVIFAEVLPKTYAIINSDKFALKVSPIMKVMVFVLAPITSLVQFIVRKTLKLFGVDIDDNVRVLSAHDELRGAIDLHTQEGSFVKDDRNMLGGILDLRELEVSDLMVHRTAMNMIDLDQPSAKIVEQVLKSNYTRLPIYKDETDNIIGILHAKDLLRALNKDGKTPKKIDIKSLCSKPWFVPEATSITDQLNAFLTRKIHFALVIDEYGELMGLITLEDIIEEIVGEIEDEHDSHTPGVRPLPNGIVNVDGSVSIRELNRALDWSLPEDEATSIAGLIIHETGTIPEIGQTFTYYNFKFEVLRKKRNQITALRITPVDGSA